MFKKIFQTNDYLLRRTKVPCVHDLLILTCGKNWRICNKFYKYKWLDEPKDFEDNFLMQQMTIFKKWKNYRNNSKIPVLETVNNLII